MRACRILIVGAFLSLLPFLALGQPNSLYWDIDGPVPGAGSAMPAGVWDSTSTNWNTAVDGSSDGTPWLDGSIAIFAAGNNATGAYTVTVGSPITVDSINFEEGSPTLTGAEIDFTGNANVDVVPGVSAAIASPIGGSVGFSKSGAGNVSIAATNLYSGPTVINGGTLTLGASEVVPDGSSVSVANGAVLDVHSFTETWGSLSGFGNVTLGSGSLVTGGDDSSTTFSGVASGSGGQLTKMGAGTMILAGANTYTGQTTISNGVLQLGSANRIADSSAVSIASTGAFDLNNFNETVGSLAGAGTVTLGGGSLTVGANNSSTAFSGAISGTGKLIKVGTGTFTNSGANTFSGGVTISGGVMNIPGETSATVGDGNPLGATASTTNANYISLSAGGTLRSTRIGAGGSFVFASRGISVGAGGGILDVTSGTTGDYLVYSGVISGSGSVTKAGAGTLLLNSANTYSGNTTNAAGTLRMSTTTVFGSAANTLVLAGGNLSCPVDANVYIQNKLQMLANTTISGTPSANSRALVFGNASIATTGGTLTVRNTGTAAVAFQARFTNGGFNFTRPLIIGLAGDQPAQLDCYTDNGTSPIADQVFSGNISGPGSLRRTCGGDGTGGKTIFSGTNTFTGGTSLNGGYIGFGIDSVGSPVTSGPVGTGTITMGQDSSDGFFASGGARTVGNTIAFGTGTNITIIGTNSLTMSGSMTLPPLPTSLNVSNTALTTFSGTISGGSSGMNFIKTGPGTLALNKPNTYVDNTLVAAGTLWVNNTSGSGTGTGTVTINSGTTLGGKGFISGAVTVNSGGKVSPGTNGIGVLTLKNGVNMSAGGTYVWELNANGTATPGVNFDQIAVSGGNVTLGGSSKLSIAFTGTATVPNLSDPFWRSTHSWTLISISGTGTNSSSTLFSSISSSQYPTLKYFTQTVDANGNVVLTYDPTSPYYTLYDAGAGFFGGENVILTNSPGLTLSVWSSARGGQSITNWTLAGTMSELPLNDGSGKSRYSINLSPDVPLLYYIVGKTTSGPYAPTVPVNWITSDPDSGNYTLYTTNVAINASGVLDLPVPPDISQQPVSKTALVGKSPVFSVVASSYTAMGYQWFFSSSSPISNGTNSSVTLASVTSVDAGSYNVIITNAHGSTTSSVVTLSIIPPLQVAFQPGTNGGLQFNGSAVAGDSYWLESTTNLTPPITWTRIATNIADSNGSIQLSDTNALIQPNLFYRVEAP